MTYFQFKDPDFGRLKTRKKSFLLKLLYIIFPKANPDFDEKIGFVCEWLIEYDNNKSFVNREVGLGENGNVIVKMPYKDNYGFWTDTDLTIEDFYERFHVVHIDYQIFNEKWNEFTI